MWKVLTAIDNYKALELKKTVDSEKQYYDIKQIKHIVI